MVNKSHLDAARVALRKTVQELSQQGIDDVCIVEAMVLVNADIFNKLIDAHTDPCSTQVTAKI